MQFCSFRSTEIHLSVPVQKIIINYYYYILNVYCFVCMFSFLGEVSEIKAKFLHTLPES